MTQKLGAQSDLAMETFKLRDAASYDLLADRFARLSDLFTAPVADKVVELAGPAPGQQLLDIGTGTGLVAFRAAERIGPNGKVLGIDLSEGMLAVARAGAAQLPTAKLLEFRKMDAEALDVKDGSFDAILSMFALLHFPDPLTALKEMFRALRPGGTAVIAVGSGPPWWLGSGWVHRWHRLSGLFRERRGRQLTAPGFLERLVKKHLSPSGQSEETQWASAHSNKTHILPSLMRQAGFVDLHQDWLGQIIDVNSSEEFWDLQITFSSIARKCLADAPATKVAELHDDFMKQCHRVKGAGGELVFPCAAFIVKARRPGGEPLHT